MNKDYELTILTEGQIWGNDEEKQLEVLKKYGTITAITDVVAVTGGYIDKSNRRAPDDYTLSGRTGWEWTRTCDEEDHWCVRAVVNGIIPYGRETHFRDLSIRPVLKATNLINDISLNKVKGYNGVFEVEFGEYPQNAASFMMQEELEKSYNIGNVQTTGNYYTFDSIKEYESEFPFSPIRYEELEYQNQKHIRIKANLHPNFKKSGVTLSNGIKYMEGDYVWIKVEPVKWLIDEETNILISKKCLVSGIRFNNSVKGYTVDFSKTEMKFYLDKYMLKELFKDIVIKNEYDMDYQENEPGQKRLEKIKSPYEYSKR